jgi:deoxyribonuclease-4
MKRAAKGIAQALSDTEKCPILLENTAGTNGPLGQNFDELGDLVNLLDGDARVGICLDSCHLLASGFDVRTTEALDAVLEEFDAKVGLDRLRCLHLNDSQIPLGGKRDRHAPLGKGEIGKDGLAVFLSDPRFEELPTLIETGVADDGGPGKADVRLAKKLRERGIAARR